jgi:hypothetical protein
MTCIWASSLQLSWFLLLVIRLESTWADFWLIATTHSVTLLAICTFTFVTCNPVTSGFISIPLCLITTLIFFSFFHSFFLTMLPFLITTSQFSFFLPTTSLSYQAVLVLLCSIDLSFHLGWWYVPALVFIVGYCIFPQFSLIGCWISAEFSLLECWISIEFSL